MSDELAWRKSSYSDEQGANCVEVAATQGALLVRDSKVEAGARLILTAGAWEFLLVACSVERP